MMAGLSVPPIRVKDMSPVHQMPHLAGVPRFGTVNATTWYGPCQTVVRPVPNGGIVFGIGGNGLPSMMLAFFFAVTKSLRIIYSFEKVCPKEKKMLFLQNNLKT
ncbi:MAG: hypothetical protein IJK42_00355 [Prevotella sp.]|nr:hypothetical protein [Prevotella sp.]